MRRRVKYTEWSSGDEHFKYHAGLNAFFVDPHKPHAAPEPGTSCALQAMYARYLEALVEVRRDFECQPPAAWEAGRLLAVYGVAKQASACFKAIPSTALNRNLGLFPRFRLHADVDDGLYRYSYRLEDFLGETLHLCQIIVARHWPSADSRLRGCIEGSSKGKVELLNCELEKLGIFRRPKIRSVVDVWLSSFDKPDGWHHPIERLSEQNVSQTVQFLDASLVVLSQVLSTAGPEVCNMAFM
jgi:hypothetical protein